jgi:hypothetical protein
LTKKAPYKGRGADSEENLGAYKIGLIANLISGSAIYSVQVTGDHDLSPDGNWVEHDTITFVTASMASNIAYPVTGLRLVIHSGTGTVNLGIARWP